METENPYKYTMSVADAEADVRRSFIKKVYMHLAFAILAFGIIESMLLKIPAVQELGMKVISGGNMAWLAVLGAFMLVGVFASKMAHSNVSRSTQYIGLSLYVVAEALIFVPIIMIARYVGGGTNDLVIQAFLITTGIFAALTFVVLTTRKDFSFLGGFLKIGGIAILVTIVASLIFGWNLGVFFSGFMVLFIGALTLYQTSKILEEYPEDHYVGAALGLFASFATMLYYVLHILISMASND